MMFYDASLEMQISSRACLFIYCFTSLLVSHLLVVLLWNYKQHFFNDKVVVCWMMIHEMMHMKIYVEMEKSVNKIIEKHQHFTIHSKFAMALYLIGTQISLFHQKILRINENILICC